MYNGADYTTVVRSAWYATQSRLVDLSARNLHHPIELITSRWVEM